MNELIFCLHIIVMTALVFLALRLGKNALMICFVMQALLGNLFVTKQMTCFSLNLTCSDVYTIGALLSLNLLQEYFSKRDAQYMIRLLSFAFFLFIVLSQIHLYYIPNSHDTTQKAFVTLFSSSPRILVASLGVGLLTQKCDIELYAFFKKRLSKCSLVFCFILSALTSQLIDTIAFSYAALYGLVYSMKDIILMSYLIKGIVILCMALSVHLSQQSYPLKTK